METDSATVIQINGNAENNTLGEFEPENRGMDGSLMMEAWEQMKQVVMDYPHIDVYYKRS